MPKHPRDRTNEREAQPLGRQLPAERFEMAAVPESTDSSFSDPS